MANQPQKAITLDKLRRFGRNIREGYTPKEALNQYIKFEDEASNEKLIAMLEEVFREQGGAATEEEITAIINGEYDKPDDPEPVDPDPEPEPGPEPDPEPGDDDDDIASDEDIEKILDDMYPDD